MTENTLPTGITEPPMDAGQIEMLLFSLDRSRASWARVLADDGLVGEDPPQ